MFTTQNFDSQIDGTMLKRGKSYFDNGLVTSIEETGNNIWTAEVEGSETYNVEVVLKNGSKVNTYSCDCPYDDDICKHAVAVFFALRDELNKMESTTGKAREKSVFEGLLETISAKDYQDFIRSYEGKNKNFKTEFELFFADKDSRIDVEEKYKELVKKLIRKYSDRGYIDYRASYGLSKEIDKFLETGTGYVGKNNFRNAFALTKAILVTMKEVIADCDDSNGNIGDSIQNAIYLLETIATSPTAAIAVKEDLYNFVLKELHDKVYFDYGDYGYNLFSVFQSLAVLLNNTETFLEFIDKQLPKLTGEYDNYRKEFFKKRKIEFLKQSGNAAEAEKLVLQNMDIVDVRMGEVNKAIRKKDFAAAKKLIDEGIGIAKSKGHSGTVSQWQKEFLHIAMHQKDINTIRHYTKLFAFGHSFSKEYYEQWKATFTSAEWVIEIENHIEETIEHVTNSWKSSKIKYMSRPYPPLLENLAPIYIEENYLDRLLPLVQQAGNLNTTLAYHPYLVKNYAEELLAIYLPALEQQGISANNRNEYADLVVKMKKIIKDIPHGKEKILTVAKRLKERFSTKPRRPAMIEELNKIL